MITTKEIEHLANLARIKLDDSEKAGLTKEIDSILTYVEQIKQATVDVDFSPIVGDIHNVTRPDISQDSNEETRESLLNEAPDREGDFIAVKKIIAQD